MLWISDQELNTVATDKAACRVVSLGDKPCMEPNKATTANTLTKAPAIVRRKIRGRLSSSCCAVRLASDQPMMYQTKESAVHVYTSQPTNSRVCQTKSSLLRNQIRVATLKAKAERKNAV